MKNKITPQDIQNLLNSAETQEAVFWNKEVVVSYRFPTRNGFSIIGRGACVDPANFDIEIGRKIAREQVEHKLWQLEGYLLQQQLPTSVNVTQIVQDVVNSNFTGIVIDSL